MSGTGRNIGYNRNCSTEKNNVNTKKTIKNLLLSVYIANKSIKLVEIFGTI